MAEMAQNPSHEGFLIEHVGRTCVFMEMLWRRGEREERTDRIPHGRSPHQMRSFRHEIRDGRYDGIHGRMEMRRRDLRHPNL